MHRYTYIYIVLAIILVIGIIGYLHQEGVINVYEIASNMGFDISDEEGVDQTVNHTSPSITDSFTYSEVPAYSGDPYYVVNENIPFFTDADIVEYTVSGFEYYSPLDNLGRCGTTAAYVGKETMPTESRGDISSVKPSGWKNKKYDFVDGGWIYNRCHLIGWQLTAENANERNLITGTRYMNVDGMLPFENMVADYVKETKNHVIYRVTPIFDGSNLVADGVLMEAYSKEDNGYGVQYCVFCYNVQPGIKINYATGANWEG